MAQQSLNVAYSDGSSQVLWEDGERVFSRGWRLDDNGNRLAVLLVASATDHPSRSVLDRLTHESELRDELDTAWAAVFVGFMLARAFSKLSRLSTVGTAGGLQKLMW